ncbi:MAG: hypothetical protein ABI383_08045 [Acidobacteriaceae bacterium]
MVHVNVLACPAVTDVGDADALIVGPEGGGGVTFETPPHETSSAQNNKLKQITRYLAEVPEFGIVNGVPYFFNSEGPISITLARSVTC